MGCAVKYLPGVASLSLQPERCTGCGACVDVCPHGVLRMKGKRIEIADLDRCMECGACVNNCAFDALSVDKGVGCATALINSMITGGEPTCGCGTDSTPGSACC